MTQPSGQLPPSVYWRRRALAIAGSVLAVVLLIWGLGALFSGSSERQQTSPSAGNANWQRPVPPSASSSSAPSKSAAPSSGAASGSPSPSAPSSGARPPAGASKSSAAPKPSPKKPPKPAAPKPCDPSLLHVTANTDRSSYPASERPKFTMSVINIAKTPCIQDVGHAQRQLLVSDKDGKRLWGSADCSFLPDKPQRHTLQPGKPVSFSIRWAGRTSQPGCPAHRSNVPAGSYTLTAKLGEVPSIPATFAIH